MKDEYELLRKEMVEEQILYRGIKDKKVIEVMKKIPRHLFIPESKRRFAYEDGPVEIGFGQTISQPYIVAYMTEQLELDENNKVLEVGTGSGYQTAILASICKEVYTMERIPQLLCKAKKILGELKFKNVNFFSGDGWKGLPDYAPFDRIIVTAAPEIVPPALKEQLAVDGIIIIPVGPMYNQVLVKIIRKNKNNFEEEILEAVRFVPLVKD